LFTGLKNHLGVFNEPEAVLIAPKFLENHSQIKKLDRLLKSSKHAFDSGQKAYFGRFEHSELGNPIWKKLISTLWRFKSKV